LCLLLLPLSASISSKKDTRLMNWSQFFFIFHYCLINFKIICADSSKKIRNLEQLKCIILFFETYRENRFKNTFILVKEITSEMDVESKFCEKTNES